MTITDAELALVLLGAVADQLTVDELLAELKARRDELAWVGPYRGPCGICGGPDARHRVADAVLDRLRAGEDLAAVADDHDLDPTTIPWEADE